MATSGVIIYTVIAMIFRAELAAFMTNDLKLQAALVDIYQVFLIALVSDGTQCWLGGVIRGLNM